MVLRPKKIVPKPNAIANAIRKDLRIKRMMIYMWEDMTDPDMIKFGDHSIIKDMSLEDAIGETKTYIRKTLDRQKYKWDRGLIKIHFIIDASDYAKASGRFYKHAKVDDYMRHVIGHHIPRSDFHDIDAETAKSRVLNELARLGQTLPPG